MYAIEICMKLITKIRKADRVKKTDLWQDANLSREEAIELVREMVLSVPKGYYRLHNRECGVNLVDTIWEMYGWIPSMFVDQPMILGLQVLYPDRVYATFTHDLDSIEIK